VSPHQQYVQNTEGITDKMDILGKPFLTCWKKSKRNLFKVEKFSPKSFGESRIARQVGHCMCLLAVQCSLQTSPITQPLVFWCVDMTA